MRFPILVPGVVVIAGVVAAGDAVPFPDYDAFRTELLRAASVQDAGARRRTVDALWQRLRDLDQIPYRDGRRVAFLYLDRTEAAREVAWRGDMTGWDLVGTHIGERLGESRVWWVEDLLPPDARLDYKIFLDGAEWLLDPDNPHRQVGGYGPNSVLRMPGWTRAEEIRDPIGVPRGRLGSYERLVSGIIEGYVVTYQVYRPSGYLEGDSRYPVAYVTDGQDYSSHDMGRMTEVLDNAIAEGNLPPMLAVFLDPRNPEDDENRRRWEYADHPENYSRILVEEIVPAIDAKYRSIAEPARRVVVGTSLGGLFAAYVALHHTRTFGCALIQSPAFEYDEFTHEDRIREAFRRQSAGSVRVFLDVGTIHDGLDRTRVFRDLLLDAGYPLRYVEVADGHSWGHWNAWVDDGLRFCLGAEGPSTAR